MELRTLLKILRRYWYLILIPPVLVGVSCTFIWGVKMKLVRP